MPEPPRREHDAKTPRETVNLAERYEQEPMPWSRAQVALGTGSLGPEIPCFLGTVRPDGRPYSAGVGVVAYDGDLYFTSGPHTRKSRNLNGNPACTLSARLDGLDLIVEGDAERGVDRPTLERVTALFRDGGWPAEVDGDAVSAPYSAQSAGPPPWHLYRMTIRTAFGVGLREPTERAAGASDPARAHRAPCADPQPSLRASSASRVIPAWDRATARNRLAWQNRASCTPVAATRSSPSRPPQADGRSRRFSNEPSSRGTASRPKPWRLG